MANGIHQKSGGAIGGGLLIGMGIGFFFLQENPMAFVGSMFVGLGFGIIIAALLGRGKGAASTSD